MGVLAQAALSGLVQLILQAAPDLAYLLLGGPLLVHMLCQQMLCATWQY